jgi:hypothetical protein
MRRPLYLPKSPLDYPPGPWRSAVAGDLPGNLS